ncbi:MAG: hypothetical protein U1E77_10935 [Inhella sp.]
MSLSPASLQALADDTAFCDALLARSRHLREQLDARMEQVLVDQLDGLAAAFKPSQVEVEVDEAMRARLLDRGAAMGPCGRADAALFRALARGLAPGAAERRAPGGLL